MGSYVTGIVTRNGPKLNFLLWFCSPYSKGYSSKIYMGGGGGGGGGGRHFFFFG